MSHGKLFVHIVNRQSENTIYEMPARNAPRWPAQTRGMAAASALSIVD
jgi:hypothetical protein